MSNDLQIRELTGTWVVRAAGAVLGESRRVQELREAGHEIDTVRISELGEVGRPHCIALYLLRKEAKS